MLPLKKSVTVLQGLFLVSSKQPPTSFITQETDLVGSLSSCQPNFFFLFREDAEHVGLPLSVLLKAPRPPPQMTLPLMTVFPQTVGALDGTLLRMLSLCSMQGTVS